VTARLEETCGSDLVVRSEFDDGCLDGLHHLCLVHRLLLSVWARIWEAPAMGVAATESPRTARRIAAHSTDTPANPVFGRRLSLVLPVSVPGALGVLDHQHLGVIEPDDLVLLGLDRRHDVAPSQRPALSGQTALQLTGAPNHLGIWLSRSV
jgi:hypothetical protein